MPFKFQPTTNTVDIKGRPYTVLKPETDFGEASRYLISFADPSYVIAINTNSEKISELYQNIQCKWTTETDKRSRIMTIADSVADKLKETTKNKAIQTTPSGEAEITTAENAIQKISYYSLDVLMEHGVGSAHQHALFNAILLEKLNLNLFSSSSRIQIFSSEKPAHAVVVYQLGKELYLIDSTAVVASQRVYNLRLESERWQIMQDFEARGLSQDVLEAVFKQYKLKVTSETPATSKPPTAPTVTPVKQNNTSLKQENGLSAKPKNIGFRLLNQITEHPVRTTVAVLLMLATIALFCLPVVGQVLGTTALTSLLVAKFAAVTSLSVAASWGLVTTACATLALASPLWLGHGLKWLGIGIKKVGEILALPGWFIVGGISAYIDKKIPALSIKLPLILIGVVDVILMIIIDVPIVLIGMVIEAFGKLLAGDKFNSLSDNLHNSWEAGLRNLLGSLTACFRGKAPETSEIPEAEDILSSSYGGMPPQMGDAQQTGLEQPERITNTPSPIRATAALQPNGTPVTQSRNPTTPSGDTQTQGTNTPCLN